MTSRAIVYNSVPIGARLLGGMIAAVMIAASWFGAAQSLGSTTLTCSEGNCTVDYRNPVFPNSREVLPAESITEVRITESRSRKKSTSYQLELLTRDRVLAVGRVAYDQPEITRIRDRVAAFLKDPEEESVSAEVEHSSPSGALMLLAFGIFPMFVAWLMTLRTRIVVDQGRGELLLQRLRFPVPTKTVGYPLREVSHAVVEVSEKGDSSVVVLLLASGERIPLGFGKSKGGDHESIARRINEALHAS